ncbi:regulatory protein RecX [Shewanella yunxiaonensis]|uniref:Regulatory protein RecX n=1 Tax=Shewanella yunxiaonensis TaxID=2829809 RepID=A0ABX7YPY1_9GAMM|nr:MULTISPECIES: regulatory protein RecX [Shewanella]MDF0534554.1 regulatory protein RecX [Shewanella sp. A32]QUN04824.1 regulatory protein RecX [Shewanella yunxiaonensis]
MDIAVALLARRDYSRGELCSRLADKGFTKTDIDVAASTLEAKGFIDDSRYAGALVRAQIAKGHGPTRIRQSGLQKGLSKDCIDGALAAADCDWFALARERALKKYGNNASAVDAKERARRIRHLIGQGFSYDQIAYGLDYDPYE